MSWKVVILDFYCFQLYISSHNDARKLNCSTSFSHFYCTSRWNKCAAAGRISRNMDFSITLCQRNLTSWLYQHWHIQIHSFSQIFWRFREETRSGDGSPKRLGRKGASGLPVSAYEEQSARWGAAGGWWLVCLVLIVLFFFLFSSSFVFLSFSSLLLLLPYHLLLVLLLLPHTHLPSIMPSLPPLPSYIPSTSSLPPVTEDVDPFPSSSIAKPAETSGIAIPPKRMQEQPTTKTIISKWECELYYPNSVYSDYKTPPSLSLYYQGTFYSPCISLTFLPSPSFSLLNTTSSFFALFKLFFKISPHFFSQEKKKERRHCRCQQ